MRKFKDSGVEWIGEIPTDWSIGRIKYNFYLKGRIGWQGLKADEFVDNGPFLVTGTDFENGNVNWSKCYHISEERYMEAPEIHVENGDLLVTKDGTVGKVAYINNKPEKVSLNSHLLLIRPNSQLYYNKFLFWVIQSPIFDKYFSLSQNGTIMASLSQEKINNFSFPLPGMETQQCIADYLDRKCSQIDAIIARQQEVIEKLKAYKLSVITEAVTKGLNPDVPMKDSGIDFIGSIPEAWRICRLRNIGTLQNGISKSGESFGHGFPFVSYGDVYRNFSLPVQVAGLIDSSDEERRNYSVESGDIFFTRTSETIEEVGFSSVCEETIPDATFAGFLIRVRPFTDDLVPKFAKYYFRSNHHRYYLVKQMNLVTRASLGQDLLKSMPVLVPPKDEQISIAAYLDKKCGAIESSIEYKQRVIERLTAYKKSLIYEVVTGKKEV